MSRNELERFVRRSSDQIPVERWLGGRVLAGEGGAVQHWGGMVHGGGMVCVGGAVRVGGTVRVGGAVREGSTALH
ncbi:MAG TPA: hypothetical protein VL857_09355 [Candidatus Eisenbacteria bacterium]|nr:hypothetical protein [Candidatus Eisenbacteria bacterium]